MTIQTTARAGLLLVLGLLLGTAAARPATTLPASAPATAPATQASQRSSDLVAMAENLGADLLKVPEIAKSPVKLVVVMTGITNKLESEPGRNLDIYVARIRTKLNKQARGAVMFVEKRATTETKPAAGGPTRFVPQYTLKGTFSEKLEHGTTYYLGAFQLTSIKTGKVVWEEVYEVESLKY